MATVEVKNLSYTYGKKTSTPNKALDNVSFKIDGGITGLIGHTGSGKSTLVQMLNGLLTPDEGVVILDGVNIWAEPKKIREVRFKAGLVMQYPEYQLFAETVREDPLSSVRRRFRDCLRSFSTNPPLSCREDRKDARLLRE